MENTKKEAITKAINESLNKNDDFCKQFVATGNATEVQSVLKKYGFDVTIEEVEVLFSEGLKEILKVKEVSSNEEFSEEQLDEIVGGGAVKGTVRLVASAALGFGFGCFCGIAPVAAGATPYVAGGLAAWTTAGYLKK